MGRTGSIRRNWATTVLASSLVVATAFPAVADTIPLERVKRTGLKGLIIGPYEPAGRFSLGGINYISHEGKLFRPYGDNDKVFRGIGQANDFLEWLWPGYQVHDELRTVLKISPAATDHLNQYESLSATAGTLETVATLGGVVSGGLLIAAIPGVMQNPGNGLTNPFVISSLVMLAGSLGLRWVYAEPFFTVPAFRHLQLAVDTYNTEVIRQGSR